MKTWLSLISIAALAACSPAVDDDISTPDTTAPDTQADTVETSEEEASEEEAAAPPGTDIHLFALDWSGEAPV